MRRSMMIACVLAASAVAGMARERPGPLPDGRVLLPSGWLLAPAGRQIPLQGIGVAMAVAPDGRVAVLVDMITHARIEIVAADGSSSNSCDVRDCGSSVRWLKDKLYVPGGRTGFVYVLSVKGIDVRLEDSVRVGSPRACMVETVDAVDDELYAGVDSTLVIARLAAPTTPRHIPLDGRCRTVTRSTMSRRVFCSLWDGAAVSVVDLDSQRVVSRTHVGAHPCALIEDTRVKRLFVACANDDNILVLDSAALHVTHVLSTAPFSGPRCGSMPSGLALLPNSSILFAANAGNNTLVVFDVRDPEKMSVAGWIPTGRSPVAVAMAGKRIISVNAFGVEHAPSTVAAGLIPTELRGSLSFIAAPTGEELRAYTNTVMKTIPYYSPSRNEHCATTLVPDTGGKSPITHVVLVVKEGRSYDEIFGDLPAGDGDVTRCAFPDSTTPNHHALARQFVLCDNFYSNALVREEGHAWAMGAFSTDALRARWPAYRGKRGQPWIFTGQSSLTSPTIGYIWDYCEWKRRRVRIYGEFTETRPDGLSYGSPGVEDNFSGMVCQSYKSYDVDASDTERVSRWAEELSVFEQHGLLPDLSVVRLTNDRPSSGGGGDERARAMDNDLALGRLVERFSHSPFWSQSVVLVVGTDADGARDHVSAHRVPALVISPWVRRGMIDSTLYSTAGMLKTIERFLGLPAMSQMDESATLMCAPFQETSSDEPYVARPVRSDSGSGR